MKPTAPAPVVCVACVLAALLVAAALLPGSLPAAVRAQEARGSVDTPVRGSAIDADNAVVRIDGIGKATLFRSDDGEVYYEFTPPDGGRQRLGARDFAAYILREQHDRAWLYQVLNISNPWGVAWVALGLLGQLLFTGRMVVQWLTSERARRSVVPPAFWWMSLLGATMLLVYFLWRRDVVGVLGQGTGWLIYARNLFLIRRDHGAVVTPTPPTGN